MTIAGANIPHLELFFLYSKRTLTRFTLLELRKCSTPMIIGTTNLSESQPPREQQASAKKLRGAQKIQGSQQGRLHRGGCLVPSLRTHGRAGEWSQGAWVWQE